MLLEVFGRTRSLKNGEEEAGHCLPSRFAMKQLKPVSLNSAHLDSEKKERKEKGSRCPLTRKSEREDGEPWTCREVQEASLLPVVEALSGLQTGSCQASCGRLSSDAPGPGLGAQSEGADALTGGSPMDAVLSLNAAHGLDTNGVQGKRLPQHKAASDSEWLGFCRLE